MFISDQKKRYIELNLRFKIIDDSVFFWIFFVFELTLNENWWDEYEYNCSIVQPCSIDYGKLIYSELYNFVD